MQLEFLRNFMHRYPKVKKAARHLMATVPLTTRLGSDFWEWYAFFEESEQWSEEQLFAYQMDLLRKLLLELSQNSSFYQQRLSGIDIHQIESPKLFIENLPPLTRKEFRENFPEILSSQAHRQRLVNSLTSGTTGMALQFHHPANDWPREWAAVCHQWKRVGYIPGKSRRAEFRGLTTNGELVEVFPERNMLRCSVTDLQRNVRFFADAIRKHEIDFYQGYPSAFHLLANEIRHSGIDFPKPKAILLASEMIYDWQLSQIQEVFPNTTIYALFGNAERTVMAGWCEYRREYHVLPQYALVEFDEITHEILGTNLFNSINGFVRYRMTDTVQEVKHEPCPDCGRPYTPRIVKLAGRLMDNLYSPQKGWIPAATLTLAFNALKTIQETRLIQREKDQLIIEYISRKNAEASLIKTDMDGVQAGLIRMLGSEIKLIFQQVDSFPRGPTGKFKWITCELDEMPWGSHN